MRGRFAILTNMDFEIINPTELGSPKGYSNGILAKGNSILFIAGQIGWNSEQKLVGEGFVEQFEQALRNIKTIVESASGGVTNICRFTIYVTDKSEYVAKIKKVGEAYRRVMGKHFPAMTLLEIKSLLEAGAKVEIEATAVI